MERLLHAASRVGSSYRLAEVLRVPHDELRTWMRGESVPPGWVVEKVEEFLRRDSGAEPGL